MNKWGANEGRQFEQAVSAGGSHGVRSVVLLQVWSRSDGQCNEGGSAGVMKENGGNESRCDSGVKVVKVQWQRINDCWGRREKGGQDGEGEGKEERKKGKKRKQRRMKEMARRAVQWCKRSARIRSVAQVGAGKEKGPK